MWLQSAHWKRLDMGLNKGIWGGVSDAVLL
jgi:hypothetical protein